MINLFREADCLPWDWDATHSKSDPIPVYSSQVQTLRFLCGSGTNIFRNCVDLAAILPFFIHLVQPSIIVNNNFVRVLRLVRVFGIMNRQQEVKLMLHMIIKTMVKSSYALGVLMLLSLVLTVFFGSIMYALESGHFIVDDDFPTGQYVRTAYSPSDGKPVHMASPFNSIGVTMYYVITTITTGMGLIVLYDVDVIVIVVVVVNVPKTINVVVVVVVVFVCFYRIILKTNDISNIVAFD